VENSGWQSPDICFHGLIVVIKLNKINELY
jgi:hypothetical protein